MMLSWVMMVMLVMIVSVMVMMILHKRVSIVQLWIVEEFVV